MRFFFVTGATMFIGMAVAGYAGIIPCIAAAVLCFFAVLCFTVISKKPNFRLASVMLAVCAALTVQTGINLLSFDVSSLDSKTCSFEATVTEIGVSSSGSDYLLLESEKIDGERVKLDFYMFGTGGLSAYDKVSGTATFRVKSSSGSGKFVSATADGSDAVVKIGESSSPLRYITEFKDALAGKVKLCVNHTAYPLLNGMVFGDTSGISYDLSRTFSRCGVSHIFSVSGLHIAIINGIIIMALSALGLSPKKRAVISLFMLLLIAVYVGLSKSVVRAVCMAAVMNLSVLFSRRSDSLNALGLSALLILLFDPGSIRDVSFLLTVTATFGIIVLNPRISALLPETLPSVVKFFIDSAIISVCAFVGTLPVTLIYFDELSVIAPITNALLSPLFTILLPVCLLICLTAPFDFLFAFTHLLGSVCTALFSFITWVCELFEKLPFCYIPTDFKFLRICYIIIMLIVLFGMMMKNKLPYIRITAAALSVSVLLAGGTLTKITMQKNVCIYQIDGTRTNGAVIVSGSSGVLILYKFSILSSRELSSALLSRGIYNIDLVISFKGSQSALPAAASGITVKRFAELSGLPSDIFMELNDFCTLTTHGGDEKSVVLSNGSQQIIFGQDDEYKNKNDDEIYLTDESEYTDIMLSKNNIQR